MGRNAQLRRAGKDWAERMREQAAQQGSTIQAPGSGPKPPFCPALSTMLPTGGQRIEVPGAGAQQSVNLQLVPIPCALNKDCMWWDSEWQSCGVVSILRMLSELYGEDENDGEQIPGKDDAGLLPDGDSPGGGPAAGAPKPPAGG